MIWTLQQVLERALERLSFVTTTYVPPLLAAAIIVLGAYLVARLVRWTLIRIFKGIAVDRFLLRTGLATMLDRSGRLRASRVVAESAYWIILLVGVLTGLSAFNTQLTSRIIQGAVMLFPKLVTAGVILIAGAWLGQYLGRSALIWACNEDVPSARALGGAVRVLIVFVSVVVAADVLDFASSVFLAAFVLLVGGAALAASLALGLGGGESVRRFLDRRSTADEEHAERSLWNHL